MMDSRFTTAIALANQAGELLKTYFRSDTLLVHYKPDHSLVTEADFAADELLRNAIFSAFPGDQILSEEHLGDNEAFLGWQDKIVWVIDPLDGTTNFNLGLHHWGVSLACLVQGRPVLGVVHFPLLGETYSARLGKGAALNNVQLRVSPERYQRLGFFACCTRTYQRYQVDIPYKKRILGCASYTYCSVARGAALVGFEVTPKVWDLAAAWLIVEESGAKIKTIEPPAPFPLSKGINYPVHSFPTLAAVTAEKLDWANQRIIPKPT